MEHRSTADSHLPWIRTNFVQFLRVPRKVLSITRGTRKHETRKTETDKCNSLHSCFRLSGFRVSLDSSLSSLWLRLCRAGLILGCSFFLILLSIARFVRIFPEVSPTPMHFRVCKR